MMKEQSEEWYSQFWLSPQGKRPAGSSTSTLALGLQDRTCSLQQEPARDSSGVRVVSRGAWNGKGCEAVKGGGVCAIEGTPPIGQS